MPRTLLTVSLATVLLAASRSDAQFPSGNPINATVPQSAYTVEIVDVLTIPNSSGSFPRMEDLVFGGEPGLAYVVDQRGPIYTFDPTDANPTPTFFFDIYSEVENANIGTQTGFRGMAFHPDFNTPGADGEGKFYTSHSRNGFAPEEGSPKFFNAPFPPGLNHDSVVGEWTVDGNGDVIADSYRELLRIGQPEFDHNIGQIGFNPSASPGDADYGNLYIALGDGGGPGDPNDLAQDISTTAGGSSGKGFPHGSILRINPIATDTDPFQVPGDNPFVGQANTIEEVWAYGLRNPHKFAWDTQTGKMLIADIGQNNVEEVNLGVAGANYGWGEREGTFDVVSTGIVQTLPAGHPTDPFTYPVAQYDHDPNNDNSDGGLDAITGGPVYRGDDLPGLTGRYLFADFSSNNALYSVGVGDLVLRDDFSSLSSLDGGFLASIEEVRLTRNGQLTTLLDLIKAASDNSSLNRTDVRLEEGPDGEVYVLSKRDGVLRRLASLTGLLPGDYNDDGLVNAADYTVWRDNLGAPSGTLPNDPEGGPVGAAQYLIWRDNYTGGSLAGAASIEPALSTPEPASLLTLAIAMAVATGSRRRG